MPNFITPRALRARGTATRPVSLRAEAGPLGLWDQRAGAYVNLDEEVPEGVTIWVELAFEDLPTKAQEYVRVASKLQYASDFGGGAQYIAGLRQERDRLMRELQHEQTSTMRNNVTFRPDFQKKIHDIRTGGLYYRSRVPIR